MSDRRAREKRAPVPISLVGARPVKAFGGRRSREAAFCNRPSCGAVLEHWLTLIGIIVERCPRCRRHWALRRREAPGTCPDIGRGLLRVAGVVR